MAPSYGGQIQFQFQSQTETKLSDSHLSVLQHPFNPTMSNEKTTPGEPAPAPAYSEFPETQTPVPVAPQNTSSPAPQPTSPPTKTVTEAFAPLPPGHPSGYNIATPLASLQRGPTPVDCPVCGYRAMTRTEAESGNTTHGCAAVLCCCFCLGCIPYLMSSLKDVNHFCGQCGTMLATWHNSGRVDVHHPARH